MDKELQKDIEFARAVNAGAVETQGVILAAANAEPFRQFIMEVEILGAFPNAVAWFKDAHRKHWADQIRMLRERYEASIAEDEPTLDTNPIAEELAALKAKVEELTAAQAEAAPEAPAEAAPEDKAEADASAEDDEDDEEKAETAQDEEPEKDDEPGEDG